VDTISLMHAKLHRVRITECKVDYVGSIGIDRVWMKSIGLLPLEEVHCWNVTRGSRFVTYAIPSAAGSREISPNGACAHLCEEGDLLIIASFRQRRIADVRAHGHRARVMIFGQDNETATYLEQDLSIDGDDFEFVSRQVPATQCEGITSFALA
jgi:aspartate 1-decarboxylase